MSEQSASRTPCLPAAAQKELEGLRRALALALSFWELYEGVAALEGTPSLREQDSNEGDEYRRCFALLDSTPAEEDRREVGQLALEAHYAERGDDEEMGG